MRTEDDQEIIEPGTYDSGDGKVLHVFVGGTEEEPELWATTFAQQLDGTLNACLLNVIDGRFACSQDEAGEFRFQVTEAGKQAVRHMLNRPDDDSGGSE